MAAGLSGMASGPWMWPENCDPVGTCKTLLTDLRADVMDTQ